MTNLYEQDQQEWFDIMRLVRKDLTREEFDAIWLEFQEEKASRAKARSAN